MRSKIISRMCVRLVVWACIVLFAWLPAAAQSFQFWPEVRAYVKLNEKMRLYFTASQTRENHSSTEAEIGPSIDFYVKPLLSLKKITIFELDQSKARPLMLRFGYRYVPSTIGPTEHRIVMEATPRFPFVGGVLFTDRNRADLRFIQGGFSWRYRNRVAAEKSLSVKPFHFTPYLRAEAYYDSRYSKFSRTAFDIGSAFPIGKRIELEGYFEHEHDTGKPPGWQVHALGAVFSLYF